MSSRSVSRRLTSSLAEQMAYLEEFISDDVLLIDDLGMDDVDAADLALGLEELWPGHPWTDDVDLEKLSQLRTFGKLVVYVENELGLDVQPHKEPQ